MRPKRLEANLALADMFVPVDARTERRLRIVHVQHGTRDAGPRCDRAPSIVCVQAPPRCDVVARCEGVRRVEANSHRQIRRLVENRLATPRSASPPPSPCPTYFPQHRAAPPKRQSEAHAARRLPHRLRNCREIASALSRSAARRPGCTTRKSAPSAMRAHHLVVKRLNRPRRACTGSDDARLIK